MEEKKNKTAPLPLELHNKKMIKLCDYALSHGLAEDRAHLCELIKLNYSAYKQIRNGIRGFTIEQMRNLCLLTGANANWVLDIEKDMFRTKGKSKPALQLLREATAAVENELAKKKQNIRPEVLN